MGYRPDNQSLEESLNDILSGIKIGLPKLLEVTSRRIESGEWQTSHIDQLDELIGNLTKLQISLMRLEKENW
jgi:hypothetical protein